jgi:hypothetical protein
MQLSSAVARTASKPTAASWLTLQDASQAPTFQSPNSYAAIAAYGTSTISGDGTAGIHSAVVRT